LTGNPFCTWMCRHAQHRYIASNESLVPPLL
jgi:hypothetical protein